MRIAGVHGICDQSSFIPGANVPPSFDCDIRDGPDQGFSFIYPISSFSGDYGAIGSCPMRLHNARESTAAFTTTRKLPTHGLGPPCQGDESYDRKPIPTKKITAK
jgi:hypothetical protein